MLSFLLSNCNYSARFSFFSSFCNFLLCYCFVYIPAGIYAKKRARILYGLGLHGEICSYRSVTTAENAEQIEE